MATPNANANAGNNAAASSQNIITALGNAFKSQSGEPLPNEHIAQLLIQNMSQLGELAKQGKLTQAQIVQLRTYAEKHKAASAGSGTANQPSQQATPQAQTAGMAALSATAVNAAAFKANSTAPFLSESSEAANLYHPISQTPSVTNPGPATWPQAQQGRPTLNAGIASGRMSGTPAQIAKTTDETVLTMDDSRTRRKNTPGEQSMRRSIQDLVSSIDPNVKIEPEVEDLLLDIADEFIDSVTNFGCRLARHRGGDTLDVKDLQLHLERNHNIRIPGFASDEARISLSQTSIAPAAPAGGAAKKGAQATQMTLRNQRIQQVNFAKKEAKLM